jgi:hypothetical protein
MYRAICSIGPGMSDRSRREVEVVFGNVCDHARGDVAASVWLPQALGLSPGVERAISSQAELHRGQPPFNAPILKWLRAHDVPLLDPHGPVEFASVSAVHYERDWRLPFRSESTKRAFFGRRHVTTTAFIRGRNGWADDSAGCRRVVILTTEHGFVVLADAGKDPEIAARCIVRPLAPPSRTPVDASIPKLSLTSTTDLRGRLERLGVRMIFDETADPFPRLLPNHGLSEILQGVDLRLDEKGISVRASTIADVALSPGPKPKFRMIFDHPFLLRVVDPAGDTVALGYIGDLGA